MQKKIEVENPATGEIVEFDTSKPIADLVKISQQGSLVSVAENLHPLLGGVSIHKIKDILALLIAPGNGFIDSLQAIRENGETSLRIVLVNVPVERINADEKPGATAESLDESPEIEGDIPETEDPEEIGAAMDADLEKLEDGADLKGDENTEPVSPLDQGSAARMAGAGTDENPFDGGTDESQQWIDGYTFTDLEAETIKSQGRAAAEAGEDRHGGEFEEDSSAHIFWMEGYDEVSAVPNEDVKNVGEESVENYDYSAGADAAERGEALSDNPNEEGSVQFRYWDQGFNSVDPAG